MIDYSIIMRGAIVTARKDIKIYYKKAPVFIFGLILPTFLFFAFFVGRQLDIPRYFPGFLAMTIFFTASSVGPLIIPWEKQSGTFERLLTLPVSIPTIILGDTIAGALFGMIISFIVLLVGTVLLSIYLPLATIVALPILFILGNICFAALGVLLSAPAGRTPSNVMMLSALIRFPLIFISGIFVPLAALPEGARVISMFSPLTYLSDGLNATMGQPSLIPILIDVAVLIGFTVAFLLTASVILKRKAMKGL
jgi:ABC-2 type transport system permease protein